MRSAQIAKEGTVLDALEPVVEADIRHLGSCPVVGNVVDQQGLHVVVLLPANHERGVVSAITTHKRRDMPRLGLENMSQRLALPFVQLRCGQALEDALSNLPPRALVESSL